jgi:hypothetical protein
VGSSDGNRQGIHSCLLDKVSSLLRIGEQLIMR